MGRGIEDLDGIFFQWDMVNWYDRMAKKSSEVIARIEVLPGKNKIRSVGS